jgi:hypothetical protein
MMGSDFDWNELSLDELFEAMINSAVQAAAVAVSEHVATDGEAGGIRFPLGDGIHQLRPNAPESAKRAAAYLCALMGLNRAGKNGDLDGAILAAFLAGALSVESWLAGEKGRSLEEVTIVFDRDVARRRRAAASTNEAHLALHSQYSSDVSKQMSEGKNYGKACDAVAVALGVSGRTVRDHTKALRPLKPQTETRNR